MGHSKHYTTRAPPWCRCQSNIMMSSHASCAQVAALDRRDDRTHVLEASLAAREEAVAALEDALAGERARSGQVMAALDGEKRAAEAERARLAAQLTETQVHAPICGRIPPLLVPPVGGVLTRVRLSAVRPVVCTCPRSLRRLRRAWELRRVWISVWWRQRRARLGVLFACRGAPAGRRVQAWPHSSPGRSRCGAALCKKECIHFLSVASLPLSRAVTPARRLPDRCGGRRARALRCRLRSVQPR